MQQADAAAQAAVLPTIDGAVGAQQSHHLGKHERCLTDFHDRIVAMYARGMTVHQIQGFIARMYATDVTPEFVGTATDAVFSEVTARQSRRTYPMIFFDALQVAVLEDNAVRHKAVYLALGVPPNGTRNILGLWIENAEGGKFWMKVFDDLKTRGVADILIAVAPGWNGMAEALGVAYPTTTLQSCIVHLIRNSLDQAGWKERKALAAAIRPIYSAACAECAEAALAAFERGPWGQKFPTVAASWRCARSSLVAFFAFPPAVRRVIYTANSIESVNARLRKIIKRRGDFPSDYAAAKLIYLALRNITPHWNRATHDWKPAMRELAILYRDRFTPPQA